MEGPAATFAVPMPTISWFGWTSSPRRAAKLVEVAIVSVSETNVIPIAAIRSGPTSLNSVQGTSATGSPAEASRPSWPLRPPGQDAPYRGRTHDGDEDGAQPRGQARQDQQGGEDPATPEQRRRVGLVEALGELPDLVEEAVGVGREPEELREWLTMIVIARPFM